MKQFAQIRVPRKKRLAWFLVFSLLGHALMLWIGHRDYEPHVYQETPIELAELPPEDQAAPKKPLKEKRPEVAETEKVPNQELDPKATFLSDRNQTAKKETKAKMTDDFREKQGTGMPNSYSKKNIIPPTGQPDQSGKLDRSEDDAIEKGKTAGVKRNWKTLTLRDLGLGGKNGPTAATDDRLDGVQLGDKTVLSTREFRYFSYYHRIKETLRQHWKPNVERKLAMLWGKGARMKDGEVVTQVLVMLDEQGKIAKITRVTGSGFEELDEAAMEAFRQSAPFPNPPAGMVDPDGLVRIRWDFILKTEASPQITFRSARQRMP